MCWEAEWCVSMTTSRGWRWRGRQRALTGRAAHSTVAGQPSCSSLLAEKHLLLAEFQAALRGSEGEGLLCSDRWESTAPKAWQGAGAIKPGSPRNCVMSNRLRNTFFPPQPKGEALFYSYGSNQQSKALGVVHWFPVQWCTLDQGFFAIRAWADIKTPYLGAVHPLFWVGHQEEQPSNLEAVPARSTPHRGVPTTSPQGTPRLRQQDEKQQRENLHGKNPAITAHGEDLQCAALSPSSAWCHLWQHALDHLLMLSFPDMARECETACKIQPAFWTLLQSSGDVI